ncbi:MAG: hypothetical protein HFE86_07865 [Clostridiales bacterium]|nr:hypothetical protein [Clostridiales bacterium]
MKRTQLKAAGDSRKRSEVRGPVDDVSGVAYKAAGGSVFLSQLLSLGKR